MTYNGPERNITEEEQFIWGMSIQIHNECLIMPKPLAVYAYKPFLDGIKPNQDTQFAQSTILQYLFPALDVIIQEPQTIYYWLYNLWINNTAPGWLPAVLENAYISVDPNSIENPNTPVTGQNIILMLSSQMHVYTVDFI